MVNKLIVIQGDLDHSGSAYEVSLTSSEEKLGLILRLRDALVAGGHNPNWDIRYEDFVDPAHSPEALYPEFTEQELEILADFIPWNIHSITAIDCYDVSDYTPLLYTHRGELHAT